MQHCWGCGVANEHGLHITSYWSDEGSGDEAICEWQPQPYHVASPRILCGGIIAALIDCHSTAAYRAEGRPITADNPRLYVPPRSASPTCARRQAFSPSGSALTLT